MADPIEYLDTEPATPDRGVDADDVVDTAQARRSGPRRTVAVGALVALLIIGLLVARSVTSGGRDQAAPTPAPASTPTAPVPAVISEQRVLSALLGTDSGYLLKTACAGGAALPKATVLTLPADAPLSGTVAVPFPPRTGDEPAPPGGGAVLTLRSCSDDASRCPEATDGQNACASTTDASRGLIGAVTRRFPTAQLASALTETVRENGRLWYRSLLFALGDGAALRVEVALRSTSRSAVAESDDGSGRVTRTVARHGGLDVIVTTAGPSGSRSTVVEQQQLAADTALLAH